MGRILIAGGSGLIGKVTTELLLQNNYEVIHLSRTKKNSKVPTYVWDIKNEYIDPEALENIDYVINFAGAGIADQRWTDARKKAIIDSRVKGNLLLKKYIDDGILRPKKIISSAAIGVYGDRGEEVLTEESDLGKDGFLAESCIQWEESIHTLAQSKVPLAMVRIGIVLSPDGGALAKMILPAKFGLGSYFGDGSQIYSWIHIDDIARIFHWLVQHEDAIGIYNGTAPNPVSNKALTQSLMNAKNGLGVVAPVPTFALSIMLGEMKQVVMWGSKVIPEKLIKEGFKFKFEQIDNAMQDLV